MKKLLLLIGIMVSVVSFEVKAVGNFEIGFRKIREVETDDQIFPENHVDIKTRWEMLLSWVEQHERRMQKDGWNKEGFIPQIGQDIRPLRPKEIKAIKEYAKEAIDAIKKGESEDEQIKRWIHLKDVVELNIYVNDLKERYEKGEVTLGQVAKELVDFEKKVGFVRDVLGGVKETEVGKYGVQYNPERGKRHEPPPGAEKGCNLCRENRSYLQKEFLWKGYDLLSNFSPIFENHLVLASDHSPQRLTKQRLKDALDFINELGPDFLVFFNGANAGASISDHYHLQGFTRQLPVESMETEKIDDNGIVKVSKLKHYPTSNFIIESNERGPSLIVINNILRLLDEEEYDYNVIFTKTSEDKFKTFIFPRNPDAIYERENGRKMGGAKLKVGTSDEENFGIASVEMGGIFIIGDKSQKPIYNYLTNPGKLNFSIDGKQSVGNGKKIIEEILKKVGVAERKVGHIEITKDMVEVYDSEGRFINFEYIKDISYGERSDYAEKFKRLGDKYLKLAKINVSKEDVARASSAYKHALDLIPYNKKLINELKGYLNSENNVEKAVAGLVLVEQMLYDYTGFSEGSDRMLVDDKKEAMNLRLKALKAIKDSSGLIYKPKKFKGYIDLHHHTFFSDGNRSPSAVIFEAWRQGMKAIGIVDHNGFEHFEEAVKAGQDLGIKVIPGIEFDFSEEQLGLKTAHLVTYFPVKNLDQLEKLRDSLENSGIVNQTNKRLNWNLQKQGGIRQKFNDKYKDLGLTIDTKDYIYRLGLHLNFRQLGEILFNKYGSERLTQIYKNYVINKKDSHYSEGYVSYQKKKYNKTMGELKQVEISSSQDAAKIFLRSDDDIWISEKTLANKAGEKNFGQNIKYILGKVLPRGGVSILAHPKEGCQGGEENIKKLLKKYNIDGLEVSGKGKTEAKSFEELPEYVSEIKDYIPEVKEDGIIFTVGTDNHDNPIGSPGVVIGKGSVGEDIRGVLVPEKVEEEIGSYDEMLDSLYERALINKLHHMSKEDLLKIPGIGNELALKIIYYKNNVDLIELQQLNEIEGMGRKRYQAIIKYLKNWLP